MSELNIPTEMLEVRENIARWKEAHGKRSRLPREMWAAAVGWARDVGAYAASRALGVSYESLKQRLEERKRARGRPRKFVELESEALVVSTGSAVVEVSNRDGSRMTVRVPQLDVGAVVAAFCGRSK